MTAHWCAGCGRLAPEPEPLVVTIPSCALAAIEDDQGAIGYGHAEVKVTEGDTSCGLWQGRTLYIGVGLVQVEVALDLAPVPGPVVSEYLPSGMPAVAQP